MFKIQQNTALEEKLSATDRDFLLAIRDQYYPDCDRLLIAGANINAKFGVCAESSQDAKSCGFNDTPLMYAVKIQDYPLARYLLENGAEVEVIADFYTPLMRAAFMQDVKMVTLLLQYKANANASLLCSGLQRTAMHTIFQGITHFAVQKETCMEMAALLIKAGFSYTPSQIARGLENNKKLRAFFVQIWTDLKLPQELAYSKGAAIGMFFNHPQLAVAPNALIGGYLNVREAALVASTCRTSRHYASLWKARPEPKKQEVTLPTPVEAHVQVKDEVPKLS